MSKEMSVGKKELEWILNNLELSSDPTCWKALKLIQSQQAEIERLKQYEPKFKANQIMYCVHENIVYENTFSGNIEMSNGESLYIDTDGNSWKRSEIFATKEEVEKK